MYDAEQEIKRAPLLCTQNKNSHIDYGTPILAAKSTDYRTCTSKYHEFIPTNPHPSTVDAEVKFPVGSMLTDVAIKDDQLKTVTMEDYTPKTNLDALEVIPRDNISGGYIRNIKERIFKKPPAPVRDRCSEFKDRFRFNGVQGVGREVYGPAETAICPIVELEREIQESIKPEKSGYWKHLDIYLTENRLNYVPYDEKQLEEAQNDFPTIYNINGKYKGCSVQLPPKLGYKSVYDKADFRIQFEPRNLSRAQKPVPNFGMKTTYSESYEDLTKSNLYPSVILPPNPDVCTEKSTQEASPLQNDFAPGMYQTEYAHLGTGWPVHALVNVGHPKKIVHKPCNLKVCKY